MWRSSVLGRFALLALSGSACVAERAEPARAPAAARPAPRPPEPPPELPRAAAPALAPSAPEGMLLVPAGTFQMGADSGGEADEHPRHEVTLPAFWLDRTEITNRAYGACVSARRCRPRDTRNAARNGFEDRRFLGPEQPITGVSWDDALAYCAFVHKRLPSEAEWEHAARGGDGRLYPWGDEPPDETRSVCGTDVTADVGTHPAGAGPFGHLDLAGNVWEWTADLYDPLAYTRPSAKEGKPAECPAILAAQETLRRDHREGFTGTNPIPTECERVLRGGAFNYTRAGLRSANRVHHPARFRLVMAGLRCAMDVGPPSSG
jgi:formylglycine-generating enzyme required for sulfatase activity